jgi:hypothetical protein
VCRRHALDPWIAEQFGFSARRCTSGFAATAKKGETGLADRPSPPHTSPSGAASAVEERALDLRARLRRGAVSLAGELGLAASTVGQILARHHMPPLVVIDPITGKPVRRRHSGHPLRTPSAR